MSENIKKDILHQSPTEDFCVIDQAMIFLYAIFVFGDYFMSSRNSVVPVYFIFRLHHWYMFFSMWICLGQTLTSGREGCLI